MAKYLLAYDLGTNGVKAALFTPEGQLFSYAYKEYGVMVPRPSWVEQSIKSMWLAQCEITKQLIHQAGVRNSEIAALAISSQRATFALLDKLNNPLSNFIGWQDARSISQCDWIRKHIGDKKYIGITGLTISPTAAISKILWIKENDLGLFERAAKFATTQCVHLNQMGVEDAPTDVADAGYSGLLDVREFAWSEELLSALDIPLEKMPKLCQSGTQVGVVSIQAAKAIGLKAGTPIVMAGGDLQCAGVGLGIVKPGLVSVGIGSGGGILAYCESLCEYADSGLGIQPHVVPEKWEIEGICLASGASFKWYRDVLSQQEKFSSKEKKVDAYDILTESAALSTPGAGGLLFMPSLAGAGAPHWNPIAKGSLLGLTLATSKNEINRALMEGICLEIRAMLESARKLGIELQEVRIWGGAAKSHFWNQISADVYGMPVVKTTINEGGLAGAAICAGVGIKLYKDISEGAEVFVKKENMYEPNPDTRSLYDDKYALYQDTYQTFVSAGTFKKLS